MNYETSIGHESGGSPDPMQTLTELRPHLHLDADWTDERRDAVLAHILAAESSRTRERTVPRRRRYVIAAAGVGCAAAAVAVLVLPGGSPGGP